MALCSIAIAAGIVGVLAVVRRLVFRRRFGHHGHGFAGHGGSCGPRGFGGLMTHEAGAPEGRSRWGKWRGRHRGGIGRSFWLRALFSRLDTTPGQEREIRSALEELQERARSAKAALPDARVNVGKAIIGDAFDTSALEAVNARADATAEMIKDAFGSALKRIHAVLDPKQRERLADVISKGVFGSWGPGGGPYRTSAES